MDHPEINGKPAAKITYGAAEKIGLPKYSNVDIGPVSVTRFVEDDPDTIAREMQDGLEFVETVLAEERARVVKAFRDAGVDL